MKKALVSAALLALASAGVLLAASPAADSPTDIPRTASGKIQKFRLKEVAATFADVT